MRQDMQSNAVSKTGNQAVRKRLITPQKVSIIHTCDHGPARHSTGHGWRLQDLFVSGRFSLQYLLCTDLFVLFLRG